MSKASLSREYVSDSDSDDEVVKYQPPADYKKCKHLKKFPISELNKNKELWLLKLPKNVDLSNLKSLPLDAGSKISEIDLNNKHYKVIQNTSSKEGSDNTNLSLLIPKEDKESLKVAHNKENKTVYFDKVFTICETAPIPSIDVEKVRVPRENVPKVEGLITRHFATGYDAEDFGIEEVSVPKVDKKEDKEHSKKRSHDEAQETPSKHKKSKKEKKEKKDKKDKKEKKEKKHKKDK
ncbi:DNA-directed RNA polymerase I subunit RPA34 [Nakaseomyces bracarensis]|uniref:DNA-directed RNA polymerase I subunit RPA34 n=1 Tax=Nakaseomyces bracarensis TaxID=273131 RepID=A0ABR4NQR3_9SACH